VRWSARLQMVLIWAVIIVLTALVYTWLAPR
jgi:hypothetical protein